MKTTMTLDDISAAVIEETRALVLQVAALREENIRLRFPLQPISTVPRDGTPVLLYIPFSPSHAKPSDGFYRPPYFWIAHFDGRWYDGMNGHNSGWTFYEGARATHWMRLPDQPGEEHG